VSSFLAGPTLETRKPAFKAGNGLDHRHFAVPAAPRGIGVENFSPDGAAGRRTG
jgi:hypothetical protein